MSNRSFFRHATLVDEDLDIRDVVDVVFTSDKLDVAERILSLDHEDLRLLFIRAIQDVSVA